MLKQFLNCRRMMKRFLKNWRYARCYSSSRRQALRLALRSARRDYGISDADLRDAYRHKLGRPP
jgi:hypothetical protein